MAQTTVIVSEPLFYGRHDALVAPKDALSAEVFIDRVTELADKAGWDSPETCKQAYAFMRAEARTFFSKTSMEMMFPDTAEDIRTHWTGAGRFLDMFKKRYFSMATITDFSTEWRWMRQGKETAFEYSSKVTHSLATFATLLTPRPRPAPPSALHADAVAIVTAQTQAVQDQFAKWGHDAFQDGQREGFKVVRDILFSKVLASGLKNDQLRIIMEEAEREEKTVRQMLELLDIKEKTLNNGKNNRVTEVEAHMEDGPFENVAAIGRGARGGGRARTRVRGRGITRGTTTTTIPNNTQDRD